MIELGFALHSTLGGHWCGRPLPLSVNSNPCWGIAESIRHVWFAPHGQRFVVVPNSPKDDKTNGVAALISPKDTPSTWPRTNGACCWTLSCGSERAWLHSTQKMDAVMESSSLRVIPTMREGPRSFTGPFPTQNTYNWMRSICNLTIWCQKKIIYEWPHPLFHPLCRQYSALSTAVRTSPRNISVSLLWACVRAPPFLLFLIWPMRVEAVQRKAHECDSSKDTLVSHGIPLRTKLARFFPNTNPLFPSFFSSLPFAVPTPDSRAIFPNPKHLIEQLGFLTCGLICSLNTWLIQKSRNSWGFFSLPPSSSSYSRF